MLFEVGTGSWHATGSAAGSGISCLARDPRDPDFLLGGGRGIAVWRSVDGGATWDAVGFPQPDVFSVAVSPVDGALYAGCEPSMLFVIRDRGERCAELASLREIPTAPPWSFRPTGSASPRCASWAACLVAEERSVSVCARCASGTRISTTSIAARVRVRCYANCGSPWRTHRRTRSSQQISRKRS